MGSNGKKPHYCRKRAARLIVSRRRSALGFPSGNFRDGSSSGAASLRAYRRCVSVCVFFLKKGDRSLNFFMNVAEWLNSRGAEDLGLADFFYGRRMKIRVEA